MAYAKQTWTDNQSPLTAARLTYIENGIAAARVDTDMPYAHVYQNTAQSLASAAVWYDITMDATVLDSHSGHSNTVNPARWTVPAGLAGVYAVNGVVNFPSSVQNDVFAARISKNGTAIHGSQQYMTQGDATAQSAQVATVRVIVQLNVGDYVTVQGYNSATTGSTAVGGSGNEGVGSAMFLERIR